jgi:threonine/homoserine/homoserine lactone efflux protein
MSILVVISTFVIGISFLIWMAYEIWRAPLLDDNYKVIRPTKTLKSLFRIKKQ